MDDCPSYMMGRTTRMTSMMWNLTRVTSREEIKSKNEATENILDNELSNLWYEVIVIYNDTNNCFSKLSHPNLLLLMGVCSGREGETIRIIFEHVNHGSLYHWIHVQVRYILVWPQNPKIAGKIKLIGKKGFSFRYL